MRRIALTVLILSILSPYWTNAAPEKTAFLAAIRAVETGDSPAAVGKLGERGAYQFRRHVWHQHTSSSFWLAHDPSTADQVAQRHFDWLVKACKVAGIHPTTQVLAMAWNAGLSRVLCGSAPQISVAYATRVSRLCGERTSKTPPVPPSTFVAPTISSGDPAVHFWVPSNL